ncbi:extensin-like isoform X2 [Coturnix japonica]|uniref:extensin-like isoform X2 n=1 Tax=Coturnix japonica TaxID=93934 RepID=UPI000777A371|nr:extensin-like isoform X2 [Coturnix japonica]
MGNQPHRRPRLRAAHEPMANETGMEQTLPHWRRAAHGAMGSNGVPAPPPPHSPPHSEPPLVHYNELSHKSCPWSRCSAPGCPFLPAPLCPPPKAPRLLPPPPKNGQPKGWAEPPEGRPHWADAVLAPLTLYGRSYPPPLPLESDGDPRPLRHCPLLVSSMLPRYGAAEGATGTEWQLGSYMATWGQPLYLGVPPTGKETPNPYSDGSGTGNRDFYPLQEPPPHPQDGEGPPWRDSRAPPPSAPQRPPTPPPTPAQRGPVGVPGGFGAGGPTDTAGSDGETPPPGGTGGSRS